MLQVQAYREMWKRAATSVGASNSSSSRTLEWVAGAPFFKSSSLSSTSIRAIWDECDRSQPHGVLVEVEFMEACKLVALEQSHVYPPNPAVDETTAAGVAGVAATAQYDDAADFVSGLSATALAMIWEEFGGSNRREDYLGVLTPLPRFEMAARYVLPPPFPLLLPPHMHTYLDVALPPFLSFLLLYIYIYIYMYCFINQAVRAFFDAGPSEGAVLFLL